MTYIIQAVKVNYAARDFFFQVAFRKWVYVLPTR